MVVASHGSPVAEKHLQPAADHESRACHPFAMPKQRLVLNEELPRTDRHLDRNDPLLHSVRDCVFHFHTVTRNILFRDCRKLLSKVRHIGTLDATRKARRRKN